MGGTCKEEKTGKGKRGEESGMGGDGGDVQRVRKLNRRVYQWGTEGSNQKVPDARKARASQDPTGMTLAEVPQKGEGKPAETISRG